MTELKDLINILFDIESQLGGIRKALEKKGNIAMPAQNSGAAFPSVSVEPGPKWEYCVVETGYSFADDDAVIKWALHNGWQFFAHDGDRDDIAIYRRRK